MTNPLAGKIAVRDVLYLGTVLVTVAGSYMGISTKLDYAIARIDTLDERVYELQGARSVALVEPVVCEADVTRVALR